LYFLSDNEIIVAGDLSGTNNRLEKIDIKSGKTVQNSVANWQKFQPLNTKVAPYKFQRPDKSAAEFSTNLA
jgi:hypothetical protein